MATKPPPIPPRARNSTARLRGQRPPPMLDNDEDPTRVDPTAGQKRTTGKGMGVPAAPIAPQRERTEPMKVISMKTPAEIAAARKASAQPRAIPQVQLRSLAEVTAKQPSLGGKMGNIAPPRDSGERRVSRNRSNVMWGAVAIALAVIVATIVWVIAKR